MAYPPASLPQTFTDGTDMGDDTPGSVATGTHVDAHHAERVAINDTVTELGASPSGPSATVQARFEAFTIPTRVEFFRAGQGGHLMNNQTTYGIAMDGFTAATWRGPVLGNARVVEALATVVWTPHHTNSGVKFYHFAGGNTDPIDIFAWTGLSDTNPVHSSAFITTEVQTVMNYAGDRYIGLQYKTNSVDPRPVIYASWIEILWGFVT